MYIEKFFGIFTIVMVDERTWYFSKSVFRFILFISISEMEGMSVCIWRDCERKTKSAFYRQQTDTPFRHMLSFPHKHSTTLNADKKEKEKS